ncbi:MAG: glycosyltransferase family 4 protein [Alphaproteobacteria bacterium]|jgi:glycosyltransferase involved in cell wall biosynthesis|nr:hypothetical protein [Alphaproteobacteria bacterium]MCS5597582.1 glycosyltransferase family 4 protein [Alphaproteobacteria bacterium]|tara:strand:- start:28963 stop:30048 length:1086 start_codon:yes stop_codon:yes gene_type:complete
MTIKLLFPFSGDSYGGSHISTLAVIDRLDQAKFNAQIVLHEKNKDIIPFFEKYAPEYMGYYPRDLGQLINKPASYIYAVYKAYKYVKTHKIDIVHCDDGPLRHIWFYAAKLARLKYVHSQQTIPRVDLEKKFIYRFYDSCVACSETVFAEMPCKNKCHVAYPIIVSNNNDMEFKNVDIFIKKICYVANMRHQKRPMIFLKTAENLLRKYPYLTFKMIGSLYDEESRQIRCYIKENSLEENVVLNEFSSDVMSEIKDADVIMVPAVGDAFGRTLVESMGVGTIVVAAKSGGHENIIQNSVNGFLIPPDDIDAFSGCIEDLIKHPERANQVRLRAYNTAFTRYNPKNTVDLYETVYTKLHGTS